MDACAAAHGSEPSARPRAALPPAGRRHEPLPGPPAASRRPRRLPCGSGAPRRRRPARAGGRQDRVGRTLPISPLTTCGRHELFPSGSSRPQVDSGSHVARPHTARTVTLVPSAHVERVRSVHGLVKLHAPLPTQPRPEGPKSTDAPRPAVAPGGAFFSRGAFGSIRSATLRARAFAAYPPSLRSVRYSTDPCPPGGSP